MVSPSLTFRTHVQLVQMPAKQARGLDSSVLRMLAFQLAFLAGDEDGMQEQLRAAGSRADSYLVLTESARAALASGDIDASRGLYARAVTASRAARVNDVAGSLVAEQALADALLGDTSRAHDELQQALAIGSGVETMWNASLAAAFSGRGSQAAQLAAAYQRDQTPSPDVTNALAPMLQAAIAVAANDGSHALALLTGATPYERLVGPGLPYLRGLAYQSLRDHQHAIAEFRSAVAQRGSQPTSLLSTLAHLSLARAEVTLGSRSDLWVGAPTVVRGVEVRVALGGDPEADRGRLERELAAARTALARSQALLGSDFAAKAPPPVIVKERAKLAEREAAVAALEAELRTP